MRRPELDYILNTMLDSQPEVSDFLFTVDKPLQVESFGDLKSVTTDPPILKLKVTRKNGNVEHYFLDARSYLPVRVEGRRTVRGTEIEGEGTMGDYSEAGGFLWPHSLENGAKGMPDKQTITIERIEVNPPIEDDRFRMPATKPADAPRG